MFESVIIALVRQASLLTKPQQDEFTTKVAEAVATLINSTQTEIDDEVVRSIGLPIGAAIVEKLQGLV
ncbi:MAG TPA: hypothetical protein PLR76_00805 [Hyphomonas sp.]|nr:hypothetical protein [Hyphomonas sp.]MCA8903321.1 hypothetical protein [Hyphomonas sp.]MCB9962238.1 hypothetical protein [Hyphomonas sp.]HPE46896.1 hypothetical protein [Hyphomonas sp.]